jgi:PD-(D/E)XK nuclease superfamily
MFYCKTAGHLFNELDDRYGGVLNKIITAEKTAESAEQMNTFTGIIIGAAIEVHRFLGPGLLESAYEACLGFELKQRGLKVERQVELPLCYKEVNLDSSFPGAK